jgi:hypothetical protein
VAIVNPAQQQDDVFSSPPFSYQPETLQQLLDFLADQDGSVEPFQLQLLCQHIERQISDRFNSGAEKAISVDNSYLGGEDKLQKVLAVLSLDVIGEMDKRSTQRAARELCERGLLSPEGHRLDLGESRILSEYRLSDRSKTTSQQIVSGV